MIQNSKFKPENELTKEDISKIYNAYKFSIVDYLNGGTTKKKVIADNIASIRNTTGMTNKEIRETIEMIDSDISELAFGESSHNTMGFVERK